MKKRVLFLTAVLFFSLAMASVFLNDTLADFNNGIFYRTFYNTSLGAVQLNVSQGFLQGNYTSQIFDGVNAQWNNISWIQGGPYGIELPDNNDVETEWMNGNANMGGNVLLLHLDETGGTIQDSSGKGNDGVNNGATYGVKGIFDKSLDFNEGDFVEVNSAVSLNPRNDFTYEAWIYWKGDNNQAFGLQNIITNGHPLRSLRVTEPGVPPLGHWNGGNQLLANIKFASNNCGSTGTELYSLKNISLNQWMHVSAVYNSSELMLFINGVLDNSVSVSGTVCNGANENYIGSESELAHYFNGLIDEVAIYNRSLSAQEIYDRYIRGAARLNLSVRSCDDSSCLGESFFELNTSSPQQLTLNNNRYFQYKFDFSSLNESVSPELYNVTIDYTVLNVPPSLNLTYPTEGEKLTSNFSLNLNFTVSDADGNLDSCWYNIDNGANITLINCANATFGVGQGSHNLRIFANDTQGEEASDSASFSVDSLNPLISLLYPLTQNYTFIVNELNYTVSDANLESCWYSLDGVSNFIIGCGDNVSGLDSGQGWRNWSVYANDSFGNLNQSKVVFFVDSISPDLDILHPQASTYGINESLPLNFTVSDSGIGLDGCWFNIDNGNNESLLDCANTTFNVTGDGEHALYLFANDSLGNTNQSSVIFTVVTSAPAINLLAPENNSYLNYGDVYLNYSVFSGAGVDSCELWHDFGGSWSLNDTKSPVSNSNYFYIFNLSDGNYNWGIVCNDTTNRVSMKNSTFNIDTLNPSLTLTQPTGTKNSLTGIPLTFSVSDGSPVSCVYNVFQGASPDVLNTTIDCSSGGGTFNVSSVGNFVLSFYVNDSAGNSNFSNSGFSVDTSSPPTPGGSGGGGGGGSGGGIPIIRNTGREFDITFGTLSEIILKRGTSSREILEVANNGTKFVNNCRLKFEGLGGGWISNSQTKGLSPGEKFSFDLEVSIPADIEPGEYATSTIAECDEGVKSKNMLVVAYRNNFDFEILDYEKAGNKLRANYKLIEFSGAEHDVIVSYEMLDFDNVPRFKGSEGVVLRARETINGIIEFELPKDSFGEFILRIKMSDGEIEVSGEKEIFLPSQKSGLTGLTAVDSPGRRLTNIGVVVFVLIGAIIVFWTFRKFQEKTKKITFVRSKRKLIRLDIHHKTEKS